MSFYTIVDTRYSDGTIFLDPDIGIFDEEGIKEAKRFLYIECYKRISRSYDLEQSTLKSCQEEWQVLSDMLKYFSSIDKVIQSKDAVIKRLNRLEEKVAKGEQKTQRLINLLNSDDMDCVIKEAGFEIVEVPVLDHCDDKTLREFL